MGQTHDAILWVALDGFVTTNFCDIVIGSLELGGMLYVQLHLLPPFRISPSLSLLLHLPQFLSLPPPLSPFLTGER